MRERARVRERESVMNQCSKSIRLDNNIEAAIK